MRWILDAFADLVEPYRVADMRAFVSGKFHLLRHRSDRHVARSTDRVVSPVLIRSVVKMVVVQYKHMSPLFLSQVDELPDFGPGNLDSLVNPVHFFVFLHSARTVAGHGN